MRCIYDSKGKHIAYEDNAELYDVEGEHIGSLGIILSEQDDQEIIFCNSDGEYLGEVLQDPRDRLLYNIHNASICSGYFKKDNLSTEQLKQCSATDALDSLPEGYQDVVFK